MTTRGLIEVFNSKNELLTRIYVASDMYPENGLMCEVARFLSKRYLVNGIPPDGYFDVVNGMDNLAALITAHLIHWHTKIIRRYAKHWQPEVKVGRDALAAGEVYLYPFNADIMDSDIEYLYQLYPMVDEENLPLAELGRPWTSLRLSLRNIGDQILTCRRGTGIRRSS